MPLKRWKCSKVFRHGVRFVGCLVCGFALPVYGNLSYNTTDEDKKTRAGVGRSSQIFASS